MAPHQLSISQNCRVIFGQKSIEALPTVLPSMTKVLLVRDQQYDVRQLEYLVQCANLPSFTYTMEPPVCCVDSVNAGVAMAHRLGIDGIIGVGGGNVMDTARSIAALLTNSGNAEDYVMGNRMLSQEPAPHVIVPTIAGSGSEVSSEALIYNEDVEAKVTLTPSPIIAHVSTAARNALIPRPQAF